MDIAGLEKNKSNDVSRECVREGEFVRKSISQLGYGSVSSCTVCDKSLVASSYSCCLHCAETWLISLLGQISLNNPGASHITTPV